MAYRANRDGDLDEEEYEDARATSNNANIIRNAAGIASATPVGAAINVADKVTGGKTTEALAKGVTNANKFMPAGHKFQDMLNKANESGLGDVASKAAQAKNLANGGGQGGPPPSSASNGSSLDDNDKKDDSSEEKKSGGIGKFIGKTVMSTIAFTSIPVFFIFIIFFAALAALSGLFGDYEDAIGMSSVLNEETGGVVFSPSSPEQSSFYQRVEQVKNEYLAKGKNVDAMKVVSTYHVLNNNGAGISYDDMTTEKIEQIADAMFDGNTYSEETFKQNLENNIIPSYVNGLSDGQTKDISKEVIDYESRYNSLVGKDDFQPTNSCGGTSTCSYNIKGYYIHGKGNLHENINIDNVYVRLMQCGSADGHNYGGTFGKALEGESLVPFEKYILGVAYQEIGPDAPAEAFKAQLVAARSYILARHADIGGWRTLKQEGDKWILQVAACTQDQVYCDPDQGCSSENGQWKMVYSGTTKAKKIKDPLPQTSPLRTYATATAGEVLVNDSGFIIYSGYKQDEQNQMINLANSGLKYKQILLQLYDQEPRKYGANDIKSTTCSVMDSTNCISTGAYSQWKQRDPSWSSIPLGNSINNIGSAGCLVTSISMLIAKSGLSTNIQGELNPGTVVSYLNSHGGFASGGNLLWNSITQVIPSWKYQGQTSLEGLSKSQKLAKIKEVSSQPNTYAVVAVKGDTGQHWVALDSVSGDTINMMDPSTDSTDMWSQYDWVNTSKIESYKVV